MAKAAGVALCLAGVLTIALYTGPSMSPVNHHRAFAAHHPSHPQAHADGGKGTWIKGTFLMLLSNTTWSLWIVLQASLLKEYPNKLLSTLVQCGLSTAQSFLLAVAVERDPAAWKLQLDVGLLAVAYSVSSSVLVTTTTQIYSHHHQADEQLTTTTMRACRGWW
jgi:drug/metabolite transporter (DMT)-like permease